MTDIKLSELTAKGSAAGTADLFETTTGGQTRSVTGQNLVDMVGADNLAAVDDAGVARGNISALEDGAGTVDESHLSAAVQTKLNNTAPSNLAATTAPAITDDSPSYEIGSVWIDTVADEAYRCVSAPGTGNAVWISTTLETGELGTMATQDASSVSITGGTLSGISSATFSGLITGNNGALLTGAATANARFTFTQTTAGLTGQIQQGSSGFAVSALGAQSLLFDTNGVNRLAVSSAGAFDFHSNNIVTQGRLNIGPTSFLNWSGTYDSIQIGTAGAIISYGSAGNTYIIDNAYFDGSNFKYIIDGAATSHRMDAGTHYLRVAPTGTAGTNVSWTNALVITDDAHATFADRLTVSGAIHANNHVYRSVDNDALVLSGGDATNSGGNAFFYGGSHATKAGDIELRSGSTIMMSYDASAGWWDVKNKSLHNLNNLGVDGSSVLQHLELNGDSGTPTLLLKSSSRDLGFPDGEALQIGHWNSGTTTFTSRLMIGTDGTFDLHGGTLTGLGALTINSGVSSDTWNSGYNVHQTGNVHSNMNNKTGADRWWLTNAYFDGAWKLQSAGSAMNHQQNTTLFRVQHAATGVADSAISWANKLTVDGANSSVDIHSCSLDGVADIYGSSDTAALYIYGGPDTDGANLLLYAGGHASKPYDWHIRTGGTDILFYDNSAALLRIGSSGLVRTIDNASMWISGGTTLTDGFSIRMFGENHATQPGDLELRSGSTIVGGFDSSLGQYTLGDNSLVGVSDATIAANGNAANLIIQRTDAGSANSGIGNIEWKNNVGTTMARINVANGTTTSNGEFNFWVLNDGTLEQAAVFAQDKSLELEGNLTTKGTLGLGDETTLTIASGEVTITKSFHKIAVESGSTDDLTVINGGKNGDILVIRPDNDTDDVVVKDGSNIRLAGDFTMDLSTDMLVLIKDGSIWVELSRSDNG